MYVITGATGNTGRPVAHALLDAGKSVRVITRSAEKGQEFADKGADVFEGVLSDRAAMERAFAGAEVAYIMTPPKLDAEDMRGYQNEVGASLANAVEKNGLKYVVTLSSVGADRENGNGPVGGLYDLEQRFYKMAGVNVLHLRPGYFMENTLGYPAMIKQLGFMGSPVNPDVKFPMIATQDIAAYAAKRLLALDFTGKSHQELQGQRDLTYGEVTKIYGEKIGKPDLKYVQFPEDQAIEGLMQMGASRKVAEGFVELAEGIENGAVQFREQRNEENTTSTSIEEFANMFAAVYNAQ